MAAFGRFFEVGQEEDWTMRNLGAPEDVQKNSSLTRHLPSIMEALGIHTVYAPVPTKFNGLVLPHTKLTMAIALGNRTVYRGAYADGCVLPRGHGFVVSLGGCSLVIAKRLVGPESGSAPRVVVSHAGLHSALNNVCLHVLQALCTEGELVEQVAPQVEVSIELAISPEHYTHEWDHPQDGGHNMALCTYVRDNWPDCLPGWEDPAERRLGRVDMAQLLKCHFADLYVPEEQIRTNSGPDSWPHHEHSELWYTTRGPDLERNKRRNLVVVAHYD